MTTLQRIRSHLDKNGIHYGHTMHSPADSAREVAIAQHIPPHTMAKTVVFHSESGFGLAVVPADEFVNLEELRRLLGVPKVRLANEYELSELFPGSELGAMPPIGELFGLPVFVDRDLLSLGNISFNAGTHRDLIHLSVADFLRLTKPVVQDFAMRVESAAHV